MSEKRKRPSLSAEAMRVYRAALKYGALLALICHLLPPHSQYRAACSALASLCGAGGH